MPQVTLLTPLDEYLTVRKAAAVVGVSVWTLRNWDRAGKLTAGRHPINGYRLYRRAELETLLRDAARRHGTRRGPGKP